jgi:pentatricopeptide repeat protein
MIDAAGKNGRMDLAIQAYNNATDPNNYVADTVTHTSMIDALVLNKMFKEAKEIYKNIGIKLPIIDYKIDLHSFSYGSAYIALSEFIENTIKPLQITIVYGKGLHSKNIGGEQEHPVKKAVNQFIKDIEKSYDVFFQEDPINFGQAFCGVKLKSTQEKESEKKNSDSSTAKMLTGYSSNPMILLKRDLNPKALSFTPQQTKSTLNPEAAPFIPKTYSV